MAPSPSRIARARVTSTVASALGQATKFLVVGSDATTAPHSAPNRPREDDTVSDIVAPTAAFGMFVNVNVGGALRM